VGYRTQGSGRRLSQILSEVMCRFKRALVTLSREPLDVLLLSLPVSWLTPTTTKQKVAYILLAYSLCLDSHALVALNLSLAIDVCTTATSQSDSEECTACRQMPIPSLDVLQTDFSSLLSLIYANTTKLSLSLKPSSPAYSAAATVLRDLISNLSSLLHCKHMFHEDTFGKTLYKEISSLVQDLFGAVSVLLQVHQTNMAASNSDDEYLMRTGAVHHVIDQARGADALSKDNVSAVRKIWLRECSALDDGLNEVNDLVEEASQENTLDGLTDDEGDGWDALGLDTGQRLDSVELGRTKKVGMCQHVDSAELMQ
jgi:cyclin-D1-binding protein 1